MIDRISIHAECLPWAGLHRGDSHSGTQVVRMFANGGAAITGLFRPCRGLALVG